MTYGGLVAPESRLWLVAALVAALVLPAVICGGGRTQPELMQPRPPALPDAPARPDQAVRRMWLARFLVQVARGRDVCFPAVLAAFAFAPGLFREHGGEYLQPGAGVRRAAFAVTGALV